LTYILPLTKWVCLHSNFSGGLRKTIFFPKAYVWVVQGHHRATILVRIEIAYMLLPVSPSK